MTQALHSQARTTHLIREEIRNSTLPQAELARLYNVTRQTIRKWQNRDTPEDKSHAPVKMYTTLSPEQELIVVELRKTLLLPTDDLLAITREFINPAVSRAGLGRCLRRHGVSDLRDLVEQEGATPVTKKTFKDYEPGFVHIDIKYLPQMPDETSRRYLFVAIDRATRWVYIELYADQTDSSSVDFLAKVQQACPVKIIKLLTDNGSQFTDRFTAGGKKKEPSGTHVFDRLCKQFDIEHRLIPPRHPQTNGMVERFNGRISDIVNQTRFGSAAELESTLRNYVKIYNHSIPQRALNHKTPVQALKDWHEKRPELFRKRVYNQPGLDTYKVWERERKFLSGYDFAKYTKGASKAGIPLHSQTIQAISEEYAIRRKQAGKVKLRWRKSTGARRSLGWIPFKASALRYRNGQLWMSGIDTPLGLWDSHGLGGYELRAGNLAEDSRGRWYINICATPKVKPMQQLQLFNDTVGVDLGLKDFAAISDGAVIEAQKVYRALEEKLGVAQRANKKARVKAIHATIANRRKDFHHKLSRKLVNSYAAIFIGNVNAAALAKTRMAKSVLDAGWSQFRTQVQYKSDDAGSWFDEVNEAFSTVTCSACGARSGPSGLKELRIREWTCPDCGAKHHRDVNSARNIAAAGRRRLEAGIPVL